MECKCIGQPQGREDHGRVWRAHDLGKTVFDAVLVLHPNRQSEMRHLRCVGNELALMTTVIGKRFLFSLAMPAWRAVCPSGKRLQLAHTLRLMTCADPQAFTQ